MKRKYFIIVFLLLLMSGTGLFFTTKLKSSQQLAAESQPPAESEPTVIVTNEPLSLTLPVTCKAVYSNLKSLEPYIEESEIRSQYTRIAVEKGEVLKNGSLLAEINGKPIFSGIADFEFYRNINIGDKGPDAELINSILIELGYLELKDVANLSVYDKNSHLALGRLYSVYGYEKPSEEEGFKLESFIILDKPSQVVSSPRRLGNIKESPIAEVAYTDRSLECSGINGQLSPEVSEGQILRLKDYPSIELSISVEDESKTQAEDNGSSDSNEIVSKPSSRKIMTEASADLNNLTGSFPGEVVLETSDSDAPVVPSAALRTQNGQTNITLKKGSGEQIIPVKIIFSANGYHKILPLEDSVINTGDQVRIFSGSGE